MLVPHLYCLSISLACRQSVIHITNLIHMLKSQLYHTVLNHLRLQPNIYSFLSLNLYSYQLLIFYGSSILTRIIWFQNGNHTEMPSRGQHTAVALKHEE